VLRNGRPRSSRKLDIGVAQHSGTGRRTLIIWHNVHACMVLNTSDPLRIASAVLFSRVSGRVLDKNIKSNF